MRGTSVREIYNAKGRQSTAGLRKKGKAKKGQTDPSFSKDVVQSDPNAEILVHKSKKDKDQEKAKLLREVFEFVLYKFHVSTRPNFSSPSIPNRNGQAKKGGGWRNIL